MQPRKREDTKPNWVLLVFRVSELGFSIGEEMRVDEGVDDRLVARVDFFELDADDDARARAAVEVVGKQMGSNRGKNVLHRAIFVDVAGDAKRRELAHFVR